MAQPVESIIRKMNTSIPLELGMNDQMCFLGYCNPSARELFVESGQGPLFY